uniref:Uncharacterized protein n=1 Tax=Solanum lycopersicum TaxID=4081 RepID=A0A3Q7HMB7_SOLLC
FFSCNSWFSFFFIFV